MIVPSRASTATETFPVLLDVRAVAKLLNCSTRHVYRQADAGHMPQPIRFGKLVRWPKQQLEAWIAEGCPKHGKRNKFGKR